jgi:hypothetical protein
MPVVAIVDGVKIEFYPDEHPRPISTPGTPNSWRRSKSGPAGFCEDRCLPQNSTVCYRGLPDISRV